MCGISGFFDAQENFSESEIRRLTNLMTHRGPDAEGFFSAPNLALGHRRLKIIDLSSAADQPFLNKNKNIALVFNGEVYNFKKLKQDLEERGHRFTTSSDTEVVIKAYEEWGAESFEKFNGMFAIGIWDNREGKNILILARDRYGIKPLFYSRQGSKFAFASELKVLLELSWVDKSVNPQTLFHYIKLSHVPNPASMVNGVEQLRPGTYLKFENNKAEIVQYWDWERKDPQNLTEDGAIEKLENVLLNSARRQTISDVPLGCFLSGGVDSSLLVAACKDIGIRDMNTFSIGYKEGEFNENQYAEAVAKKMGTKHFSYVVGPKDYFDLAKDYANYFDQPFGDPTALSSLLLAKRTSERVKVVLSGDGGDELFFGYPYQQALRRLKSLSKVPAPIRKTFLNLVPSFRNLKTPIFMQKLQKLKDVLSFNSTEEMFFYFLGTIGPLKLAHLASLIKNPVNADAGILNDHFKTSIFSWEELVENIFLKTFLVDTALHKTDRAGMAFGLEARVPFLDNEMVDFSRTLPFNLKFKNGKSKYILRLLMKKKVSESLSKRPKQGFSIPMREWLRGDLKYLINDYLDYDRLKRDGHFNPNEVHKIVSAHLKHYANHSHLIWSLISFQMWRERYLK